MPRPPRPAGAIGWVASAVVCASLWCGPPEHVRAQTVEGNILRLSAGAFEIPPGESLLCAYTSTVLDRTLYLTAAWGHQESGGHHLAVYYTMKRHNPQEPQPCSLGEVMGWSFIAGVPGREEERGALGLPEGVGIKIPAGAQLILQSHYINGGPGHRLAEDWVELELKVPGAIAHPANLFVVNDHGVVVPPGAHHRRSSTCTAPSDLAVLWVVGHMHEFGSHYQLQLIETDASTGTVLLEHDWEPMFTWMPPKRRYTVDQPLRVPAGGRLRQTCEWRNATSEPITYSREMCATVMMTLFQEDFVSCDVEGFVEE